MINFSGMDFEVRTKGNLQLPAHVAEKMNDLICWILMVPCKDYFGKREELRIWIKHRLSREVGVDVDITFLDWENQNTLDWENSFSQKAVFYVCYVMNDWKNAKLPGADQIFEAVKPEWGSLA